MRVTIKIRLWGLLILLALFVQSATVPANAFPSSLPDTDYDGFVYYNKFLGPSEDEGRGEYLIGRIDFAVYDTEGKNEFVVEGGYEAPGTGRYVYAYQIFNAPRDVPSLYSNPVAYFAVFGITGDLTVDTVDGIGAQEGPDDGVEHSDAYFDGDESRVVWEFTPRFISLEGEAENSWFLVFSSDQPPVPGNYDIRAPEEEASNILVPAPEPATIALLGLGSALIFSRRRKPAR